MSRLLSELKRRNVWRVAALYLVCAWLIAQVTDVVTGLADWPPSVGRAVLIILASGFPVALGLAWLFEWTPAGIRREDGNSAGNAAPRRQRIDYVILAVLVVALAYFAVNHNWQDAPTNTGASIAVLPFENRSALPDDRFFVDGVHDDLLTQLAKIGSLVVISRTSVGRYRDTELGIREIAAELGVTTVLEGAVQRAGGQVRINLQLIDAATDNHLWAEIYDRPLTAENVFEIQSEIATTIAGVLRTQLLPEERRRIDEIPTTSLAAYDAYLLGRQQLATRDYPAMEDAVRNFERAIDLDAEFALAYTGLADTLSLLAEFGATDRDERLSRAEAAATRALVINPDLGEAHTSRGLVKRFRQQPYEDYIGDLARGVQLSPGYADARKWYSNALAEAGQYEEALEHIAKAAQLDPLSPIIRINYAQSLNRLGRPEEAAEQQRKAFELDPTFMPALPVMRDFLPLDEQLATLTQVAEEHRDNIILFEIVRAYLDLGDSERAREWFRVAETETPGQVFTLVAGMQLSLFVEEPDLVRHYALALLPHESAWIPVPSRSLALLDIRAGKPDYALQRYRDRYPEMFSDAPPLGENYALAIDVALVMQQVGEQDHARRLLEQTLSVLTATWNERAPYPGLLDARALALLGRTDEAIAHLQSLIESDWTSVWWFFLEKDVAFAALHDDPRFAALVDVQRRKVARMREQVRVLESSGEIVPPPRVEDVAPG